MILAVELIVAVIGTDVPEVEVFLKLMASVER